MSSPELHRRGAFLPAHLYLRDMRTIATLETPLFNGKLVGLLQLAYATSEC